MLASLDLKFIKLIISSDNSIVSLLQYGIFNFKNISATPHIHTQIFLFCSIIFFELSSEYLSKLYSTILSKYLTKSIITFSNSL